MVSMKTCLERKLLSGIPIVVAVAALAMIVG